MAEPTLVFTGLISSTMRDVWQFRNAGPSLTLSTAMVVVQVMACSPDVAVVTTLMESHSSWSSVLAFIVICPVLGSMVSVGGAPQLQPVPCDGELMENWIGAPFKMTAVTGSPTAPLAPSAMDRSLQSVNTKLSSRTPSSHVYDGGHGSADERYASSVSSGTE